MLIIAIQQPRNVQHVHLDVIYALVQVQLLQTAQKSAQGILKKTQVILKLVLQILLIEKSALLVMMAFLLQTQTARALKKKKVMASLVGKLINVQTMIPNA